MFSKLSVFALLAPLVSALQLQTPADAKSGSTVTIKWTNDAGDPATFSFELVNEVFHNAFAIANNVQPGSGSLDVTLPIVPVGPGYTLQAVDIGDINKVYATSGAFSIGETSSSTSSGSSSASSSASGTASSGTSTTGVATSAATSSGFGTTVTKPASTGTSGAASASTTGPSPSIGAASPLRFSFSSNAGAFAVILVSAVAGAALVV